MALAWDPVSQATRRPTHLPYLYNIEIWHERALSLMHSLANITAPEVDSNT